MVYPRFSAVGSPEHHPASSSPEAASPNSTKKKRKKLPKSNIKPGASTRKNLRYRALEQAPNATDKTSDVSTKNNLEQAVDPSTPVRRPRPSRQIDVLRSQTLGTSPASSSSRPANGFGPSETFLFASLKQYRIARALFSNGYSSANSPRFEDANIKATLRWNQVMTFLTTAPVSCITHPIKGVSIKIVRPARNGVEGNSLVLHKPHGKNPRCEREVLENFATAMKMAFGWEKDGFVLVADDANAVAADATGEDEDEDDDDDDDDDDDATAVFVDIDAI